mmetsp:Transcript_53087/g.153104  ORF Transcript_53087/g.153104 Transcript_53087/m.153104 type:complete len:282 (+) Transcript_53087:917-1762(+)
MARGAEAARVLAGAVQTRASARHQVRRARLGAARAGGHADAIAADVASVAERAFPGRPHAALGVERQAGQALAAAFHEALAASLGAAGAVRHAQAVAALGAVAAEHAVAVRAEAANILLDPGQALAAAPHHADGAMLRASGTCRHAEPVATDSRWAAKHPSTGRVQAALVLQGPQEALVAAMHESGAAVRGAASALHHADAAAALRAGATEYPIAGIAEATRAILAAGHAETATGHSAVPASNDARHAHHELSYPLSGSVQSACSSTSLLVASMAEQLRHG